MTRRAIARIVVAALVAAVMVGGGAAAAAPECELPPDGAGRPGLAALRNLPPDQPMVAVAVHRDRPAPAALAAFEAAGLTAQSLRHLPMTILFGRGASLVTAAEAPGVVDIYPNRRLEAHSRTSTQAIRADRVWEDLGHTGAGVGIAIVDSGIDATHPAFEGRVRRNVKIVGPAYLAGFGIAVDPDTPPGTIVLPADEGPYSNTDVGGHGTHVAGIVAAGDVGGDEDDSPVGVAPDAHLLGYAVGELFVFTMLAAFDDILEHRGEHNIRVVNNSWGERFRAFDPNDPINVATRELAEAGIVVTFSAGNGTEEMSLNPFAAAPWVTSAGSAALAGTSSPWSSGGLRYDNARLPGEAGYSRYEGDSLGLYHPHVLAPGERIVSTATPGRTTQAQGTSMAAPHVAGVAALLLGARPGLSPDQVKQVLQVTAMGAPGHKLWKSGFGFLDARAALDLVVDPDFTPEFLDDVHQDRSNELLALRDRDVHVSDHWSFDAVSPAAAAGRERYCLPFAVDVGTAALHAGVSFAGTAEPYRNDYEWSLTIRDAAGSVVGRSRALKRIGISLLEVDLTALTDEVAFGTWTAEVVAEAAVSAPRPLYSTPLTLVVTQLGAPDRARPSAGQDLHLPLVPHASSDSALLSAEGCAYEPPATGGGLSESPAASCRAALVGTVGALTLGATEYISDPFEEPLGLGGAGSVVLHLADEAHATWGGQLGSRVFLTLEIVPPESEALVVASEQIAAQVDATPVRGEYQFVTAPTTAPAGSRLRLRLEVTGAHASGVRLLYGGQYDSKVTLQARSPRRGHRSATGQPPRTRKGRFDAYEEAVEQG